MPYQSKAPKAEVELDGEKVEFKEGALRKQLGMKKDDKLSISMINKMLKSKDGEMVEAFGKMKKMTPLLRRRLNFAKTLMKRK